MGVGWRALLTALWLVACRVLCSGDQCMNGHAVLLHNSTGGVAVTYRSSAGGFDRVTLEADSLPTVCGSGLRRCDVTVAERGGATMLVVPVARGAALVKYELQNHFFSFQSHHVMQLPLELNCELVKVFNFRNTYLGFCLNIDEGFIRALYLSLDFDNLEMSQFEALDDTFTHTLDNPASLSEVILIEGLACADFLDFFFFLDDAYLKSLVFTGRLSGEYEVYDLEEFVEQCTYTTGVQRISDTELVVYCNGTTIIVDVCERTISQDNVQVVDNIASFDPVNEGIPYYCDNSKENIVFRKSDTLTLVTLSNDDDVIIPFSSDGIVAADCYSSGDESNFVYTTESSETHLTRILENSTQQLAENSMSASNPFMLHSGVVVVNNNTESLVYNDTCRLNPVIIQNDHPADFSRFFLSDTLISCECFPQPPASSTVAASSTPTSTLLPSTSQPLSSISTLLPSTSQPLSSIQPSPSMAQPSATVVPPATSLSSSTSEAASRSTVIPTETNTVGSPSSPAITIGGEGVVQQVNYGVLVGVIVAFGVVLLLVLGVVAVVVYKYWVKQRGRADIPQHQVTALVGGSHSSSYNSSVDAGISPSLGESSFIEGSPVSVKRKPMLGEVPNSAASKYIINGPAHSDVSESNAADSGIREILKSMSSVNSFHENSDETLEYSSVCEVPPNGEISPNKFDGDMPKLISHIPLCSTLPNQDGNPTAMAASNGDVKFVLDKNQKLAAVPAVHSDLKSLHESEDPQTQWNTSHSNRSSPANFVMQTVLEANRFEPNTTAEQEYGMNIQAGSEITTITFVDAQRASADQDPDLATSDAFVAMETSPFSSPVQEETPDAKALIAGPKVLRETDM